MEAAETEAPLPISGPASLKLPVPVKFLAAVAVFVIMATASSIGYGIVSMRNFFIKAVDPQYMSDTAKFVTGVTNPIPEPGYNPVMAANLNRAVVFFENPKEKTQVSFWGYTGQDLDGEQELDRIYDMGIWTPSNWGKFQSVTSKGKKEINGKPVTYIQGPLKDQSGDTYEGLIAAKIEGDKIVLLQIMQPSDRPFDTDKALGWLARP